MDRDVFAKEIERKTRLRLGNLTVEVITPLDALKAWLEAQKFNPERARILLEYGEKLIREQKTE